VTEENELSEPEKAGVKKHPRRGPARAEKLDILRRLFRKYSLSALSKWETIDILKRFVRKLSAAESEHGEADDK